MKVLLIAACGVGLMLSAAVADQAEAGKRGGFRAPTSGKNYQPRSKRRVPPVVRDHRDPSNDPDPPGGVSVEDTGHGPNPCPPGRRCRR